MPEPPCKIYPYMLLTGRGSSAQWHTQTRTGKSAVLAQLSPAGIYVEMNPDDAQCFGIEDGGPVIIASRRGQLRAAARLTPTIPRGQLFIPMHFEETNLLTLSVVDPHSRQPAYKACAVSVRKG